jgi:hypothetical protein
MDNTDTSYQEDVVVDPHRRLLLSGLAATCASLAMPLATAQTHAQSRPQYAAGSVTAPASFPEVSRILTGRSSLNIAQAGLLYRALAGSGANR